MKKNKNQSEMQRLMRFISNPESEWLSTCLKQFKDPISFTVPGTVPVHVTMSAKLHDSISDRQVFIERDPSILSLTEKVVKVMDELVGSWSEARRLEGANNVEWSEESLSYVGEVVHEQEQEQEQEQEEEQEMEEQKMSQYSRDDEQANAWDITCLQRTVDVNSPFYCLSDLKLYPGFKSLQFNDHQLLSDNFFRPSWGGSGSRRLKNVAVVLEWLPLPPQILLTALVQIMFKRQPAGQQNASKALQDALMVVHSRSLAGMQPSELAILCNAVGINSQSNVFVVAVSLAEAETIRRAIHTNSPGIGACVLILRTIQGNILDFNGFVQMLYPAVGGGGGGGSMAGHVSVLPNLSFLLEKPREHLTCMKFFNGEMYFSNNEISTLNRCLMSATYAERKGLS